MDHLTPQQKNALQAGGGLLVVGVVLLVIYFVNLIHAQHLGVTSAQPEVIALDQLLARGAEGNPNVLLQDFHFANNFIANTTRSKGTVKDYNTWNYAWLPVFPNKGLVPAGAAVALVKKTDVGNQSEVEQFAQAGTVRGMVINKMEQLNDREIELIRQQYPQTDFSRLLLIEANRSPPFAPPYLGLGGMALVLLGAVILVSFFGGRLFASKRRRRRRRRIQFEEE